MDALHEVISQPPTAELTSVLTQLANDVKSIVELQDIFMGWLSTTKSVVGVCRLDYCNLLISGGEQAIEDLKDPELKRILEEHHIPLENQQFDRTQMVAKVKQLWVSHYRKMLCRSACDPDALYASLIQMSLDTLSRFGDGFGISLEPSDDKMALVAQLIEYIRENATAELPDVSSPEPADPLAVEESPSTQSVEEVLSCCVCFEEDVEFEYFPCAHLSTCVTCASRLDRCPLCRMEKNNCDITYQV